MEPKTNDTDINDESEIDKILEESIASVRAEKPLTPPEEVKTEEKVETQKVETETKVEQTAPAQKEESEVVDNQKELSESFKNPVKGKFESEEAYEKRVDLAKLVFTRKNTKSDEEKQRLSTEISSARQELRTIGNKGENISTKSAPSQENNGQEEKVPEAATKQDIEIAIQKRDIENNVRNTLNDFVKRHPELKDDDTREVFFDFVDSNYNWNNKTGKDLMTVLELARENMFKPSESVQERVIKGANVQEKVNAMQFPGGTVVKQAISPEKQKSVDELKATGMSEEKALELLED